MRRDDGAAVRDSGAVARDGAVVRKAVVPADVGAVGDVTAGGDVTAVVDVAAVSDAAAVGDAAVGDLTAVGRATAVPDASAHDRERRIDTRGLQAGLDAQGWFVLRGLLSHAECEGVASMYASGTGFRSHVVMARHGFGRGEYRYFAYPLPPLIQHWRTALYPSLAPIANAWHERMGLPARFPATHAEFIARCAAAGQNRPTPLLLQYGAGDYNCLHQDLYGEHVFPLQVAVLLSSPGADFCGGEFVLTEQRPRMQSRATVVPLGQGDAVVFAVNSRPVRGTRGDYRVTMRHGVSTITAGHRHTLGIIFHDAR